MEPGLGLGLSIVKHLVEAHGGHVGASSDGLGRGAAFEVRLPVPAVLPATAPAVAAPSVSLEGIRVLVVDDQPDARESLSGVLRQFGAEVRASASVREALDAVNEFLPHVLLADIAMPGEDAYDLIKRLRDMDNPALRHLPAAALTAYCSIDDRFRVLSAGYQLHVPKPVQPLDLALTVAEMARKVRDAISPSPEAR